MVRSQTILRGDSAVLTAFPVFCELESIQWNLQKISSSEVSFIDNFIFIIC